MVSEGRGGDWGAPVQGEVEGGKAPFKGSGRVVCPEDGQGGEGEGKTGRGRIVGGGGRRLCIWPPGPSCIYSKNPFAPGMLHLGESG